MKVQRFGNVLERTGYIIPKIGVYEVTGGYRALLLGEEDIWEFGKTLTQALTKMSRTIATNKYLTSYSYHNLTVNINIDFVPYEVDYDS